MMLRRTEQVLFALACFAALACGREAGAPPARGAAADVPVAAATAPKVATEASPVAAPAPSEECVEVDSDLGGKHITLEGRLVVDDAYQHPARGKTRPYILRLDAPRCAVGVAEASIAELHLAASEGVTLKPLVGKRVRVSGDPFLAHTAWHARPVMLMTTTAKALP